MSSEINYLLKDLKIIQVTGEDAKNFLQNLCTSDINKATQMEGLLAGFCSPKGRLLASFWITNPQKNTYLLWLSEDIALEFLKKLTMYKLRSKVALELLHESWNIFGVTGKDVYNGSTEELYCKLPDVRYLDQNYQRCLIATKDMPSSIHPANELWSLLEIFSAIPRITSNTRDLFVPQMINFESVFGIDFKKGCYPGQEIVARSQYLGTIKRRLMIGFVASDEKDNNLFIPGTSIYLSSDREQEVGVIVLSSYSPIHEGYFFQFEIMLSYLESALVVKDKMQDYSPITEIKPPPYPFLEI